MSMHLPVVLQTSLVVLTLAALALTPAHAQGRRELRVGIASVPAVLDPMASLDGATPLIARQVFDTLVAYREASTDVEPALALRWSVARDGLTWTFHLRDNARFHDGSVLTASDVAAAFARGLRPELAAPPLAWAALLRGAPGVVKDVKAIDVRTVQIALLQPYAPLLTVLAHPALAVTKAVTAADGVTRVVGTGPFRVVDASGGRLTLESVPGHWSSPPRMDRVVFVEIRDDAQAEAEFEARTLDIWFPPGAPRRADGAVSIPGLRVGYLAFQTEKDPFARKKVRQAVAAAIDPPVLAAALGPAAVPLQSFLPPGIWARREGSPALGGSRAQVRALLREGGWPAGTTPTMLAPGDLDGIDATRLTEALGLMLGAADVPVRVQLEPGERVREALQRGAHELALAETSVLGGDPHFLLFPLSTSEGASAGPRALNFSFYRDPRLDDVLIRASQLSSRMERGRLYQRAQGLLADEMPWIPLYVRLVWGVTRPEVRQLRLHPTGIHRLTPVLVEQP